jgi:hypothetical protein
MATFARTSKSSRPADGSGFGNAMITGRTLQHFTVTSAGMWSASGVVAGAVDFLADGSDYNKLVQAISQVGSIELLGTPLSGNVFHVGVSGFVGTAATGDQSLQAYCNNYVTYGSGVTSATVADFVY